MKTVEKRKVVLTFAVKRRKKLLAKWNKLMVGSIKGETTASLMKNSMGLLRVHVKRGKNLAIRDVRTSDPYVKIKMGHQKVKTRIVRNDVNPEWNDDLTLSISDPSIPIKLNVYDHDTWSKDDKMGDAEFEIAPYVEAINMNSSSKEVPKGTVISRLQPSTDNCLSGESAIYMSEEGKIIQDLCLKLRNVECGEVELQLEWIHFPDSKTS